MRNGSRLGRLLRVGLLANTVASSPVLPPSLRRRVLALAGIRISGRSRIYDKVWFGGTDVSFGDEIFINRGVIFDNSASITVGSRVNIGHDVLICTSTHEAGDSSRRAGAAMGRPVSIGAGTWIGARAVILPGVTIGESCVIAAGAVVNRDCAANATYAGVPARKIADLR